MTYDTCYLNKNENRTFADCHRPTKMNYTIENGIYLCLGHTANRMLLHFWPILKSHEKINTSLYIIQAEVNFCSFTFWYNFWLHIGQLSRTVFFAIAWNVSWFKICAKSEIVVELPLCRTQCHSETNDTNMTIFRMNEIDCCKVNALRTIRTTMS